MGTNVKTKKFSVKKLLLTIGKSIIFTTFVGFTILFLCELPACIGNEIVSGASQEAEILTEIGDNMEEHYDMLQEEIEEQKKEYGEDYPAGGIMVYRLVNFFRSNTIMNTYVLTLLSGILLGTIIYIVSIQEAKGIELAIELFIALVIVVVLILLVNFIYQFAVNKIIGVNNLRYDTYVYDIESISSLQNNLILPYCGTFVVVYVVNMIKQKTIARKLNKELEKNK